MDLACRLMGLVRIYNPISPRKPKAWTYAQAEDRKEKAEWAARELQGDDERGDEIADMSVEQYAEDRGVEIVNNPYRRGENQMRKKVALKNENESLQEKLDAIQEIVECDDPDCTAEEHIEEISDILAGKDDKDEHQD